MADSEQDGSTKGKQNETPRTTKVARLIEEYDLAQDLGAQLESMWTADGDERKSLRTLADIFNKRLLEAAVSDANMQILDGELDNIYRLLTADDVSSGKRTETRHRLEQEGIEVDKLKDDFVTYQSVRTYLKNNRDAEYNEKTAEERLNSAVELMEQMQSRVRTVSQATLERLCNKNIISIGDFRVFIEINIYCKDCGNQYRVIDLLKYGECECE